MNRIVIIIIFFKRESKRMICNLTNKNSNQSKPMLKKRKLSRFIRNKEKFVLFKKYSKNLRNGDHRKLEK